MSVWHCVTYKLLLLDSRSTLLIINCLHVILEPFDRSNTARSVRQPFTFERILTVFQRSYQQLLRTRSVKEILNNGDYTDSAENQIVFSPDFRCFWVLHHLICTTEQTSICTMIMCHRLLLLDGRSILLIIINCLHVILEPFDRSNTARSVYHPFTFEQILSVFQQSHEEFSRTRNINVILSKTMGDFWLFRCFWVLHRSIHTTEQTSICILPSLLLSET